MCPEAAASPFSGPSRVFHEPELFRAGTRNFFARKSLRKGSSEGSTMEPTNITVDPAGPLSITFRAACHDRFQGWIPAPPCRGRRLAAARGGSGRPPVIIAGTALDVCAQLPALACAAEGYDAYVAVDACGRFSPAPSVATVSRLTQAGIALVDTRVIVLESMADNAHPKPARYTPPCRRAWCGRAGSRPEAERSVA
jgi:Isochorismatase family